MGLGKKRQDKTAKIVKTDTIGKKKNAA